MLQLSHLPPPAIFEHSESLHAITLSPLATFLARLTSPAHLRTLHEILEKYRTPESYHRIDVRELGSSEIPIDPELEDPIPAVVEEGGEPVILEKGRTREQYREEQTGLIAAQQLALEHPELLDPAEERIPNTFAASTDPTPVLVVSTADLTLPISDAHSRDTPLPRLPPGPPLRRVRELRLDLRTLDAAALFALETWRRAELGIEKLDMEVPQSIWYKPPTPPPAKRKPGRPRKSAPAPSVDREGTAASSMGPPRLSNGSRQASVSGSGGEGSTSFAAVLKALDRPAGEMVPVAGPSHSERSPSPDEIRPDAYNENEALDPSFIPPPSPGPSSRAPSASLGPDGEPRPRRGRPSKADIAARTTYIPDGTAVVAPRPKAPKVRKKPRQSAPASMPAWGSATPLYLQQLGGEGSRGTSTPSTDTAWEIEPERRSQISTPANRAQQGSTQAVPLDLLAIQSPSRGGPRNTVPDAARDIQLAADGSTISGHPARPPPPTPTPSQSAPKKLGRPPKTRPSLDPFGASLTPPSLSSTTAVVDGADPSSPQTWVPMTATSAPLPPALLRRVATLQEAMASSSSSLSTAPGHHDNSEEKRGNADLASRIVADISALPPSPNAPSGKGKGRMGTMEISVEIPTQNLTPTAKGKGKKWKSMDTPGEGRRIGKRMNMTKVFREYAEEWAFLKGL